MSEVASRLRRRVNEEGLPLSEQLQGKLIVYFELLQRWNRKINLTALTNEQDAVDRLLIEPVSAAKALPRHSILADLGSGGGSPAIPLALALESPRLLMVESRSRKAAFLREAARAVQLDAEVEARRFEEVSRLAAYSHAFDAVSVRAVRQDDAAMAAAAALLKTGGTVALFAGVALDPATLLLPPNLTWRGTVPLLRSTNAHLALLFHVEHVQ